MTVVSSKEFVSNENKYEVLEPDDDFHNAISADEFKERALEIVEKVHNMYYPSK